MAIRYNSNYDETIPFSDVCAQVGLTQNVELTWTVPGSPTTQYQAYFGYNSSDRVFVSKNVPASYPGPNFVTEWPYTEERPIKRYVNGGDVLSFITPDATAFVTVSIRSLGV